MAGSESLICLQMEGFPTAVISIPPPHSAPVSLTLSCRAQRLRWVPSEVPQGTGSLAAPWLC